MSGTSVDFTQSSEQEKKPAPKILRVKSFKRTWSDGVASRTKRTAVMSVARDSTALVSTCFRTEFGDVTFNQSNDDDYSVVDILKRIMRCRPEYLPYKQIWVLQENGEEGRSFYSGLEEWAWNEEFSCLRKSVRSVCLSTLESAFERPVEGIARLARNGRLGFPPDMSLTNLDAIAAAITVFAEQLVAD